MTAEGDKKKPSRVDYHEAPAAPHASFWSAQGARAQELKVGASQLAPAGFEPRMPHVSTLVLCAVVCLPTYIAHGQSFDWKAPKYVS